MALSQNQVSQLYVAIFNRASEGSGNSAWQRYSDDAAYIATTMLSTPAAQDYFGDSLNSNQAFVEHIYRNTLNKTLSDDPDGIAAWVEKLDNEEWTRGEMVVKLIETIDLFAPGGGYYDSADQTTKNAYNQFANRVEVSNYMADTVQETPSDYATSTSFSAGLSVTFEDSSVESAKNTISTTLIDSPIDLSLEGQQLRLTMSDTSSFWDTWWFLDDDTAVNLHAEPGNSNQFYIFSYAEGASETVTLSSLMGDNDVMVYEFMDSEPNNGEIAFGFNPDNEAQSAYFTVSNVGDAYSAKRTFDFGADWPENLDLYDYYMTTEITVGGYHNYFDGDVEGANYARIGNDIHRFYTDETGVTTHYDQESSGKVAYSGDEMIIFLTGTNELFVTIKNNITDTQAEYTLNYM